jgi:hypothetical protein
MPRLRRIAGFALLALFAIGLASSAGVAFASGGGCCAGMTAEPAAEGAPAPCRSLTASACCEANASGPITPLPGAPSLAWADAGPASTGSTLGHAFLASPAPGAARASLATTVLRL